ncbi:hypothetical protein DL96DRAFT_1708849 [Flagelloscypha sp. PMI_526]|nr:hypothetical protein DL96DRAFT_1708849 [Flagelloscypha sp. PMI_526]
MQSLLTPENTPISSTLTLNIVGSNLAPVGLNPSQIPSKLQEAYCFVSAPQNHTALTFLEMSTPASPSPTHTPLEYLPSQPHTPPALSTMATPVDPQYIQVLQRLMDALDGLTIAPGPVSQIRF